MQKNYNFVEVSENQSDITKQEKELKAHKFSVTLHTPEGKIKADNFILTAVNKETGKLFFSARDSREGIQAITMLLTSIADTAGVLYELSMKYLTREEALQAIADIEEHLKKIRDGNV